MTKHRSDEYAEVYPDASGEFRWRVKDFNNDLILADGGQGYDNRADALAGLSRVTRRDIYRVETKSVEPPEGFIRVIHLPAGEGPHSRACGIREHSHGTACHPNCPTCHGRTP